MGHRRRKSLGCRRAISKRGVRADGVVVVAPLLDDDLGFLEAVEDFPVEQLVAQLAVEALAVAVLPGTAGFDVERLGSDISKPLTHDLGRHLRAIVGTDVFGDAADQHHIGHRFQDTEAVDPAGHPDRQTLPRELVDQRHQPDLAAVVGLGLDEVVRPDVIAPLRPQPDAGTVVEP